MAVQLSCYVPIGSMCLVISVLRSGRARLPIISGSATPGFSVSLLASEVMSCGSIVSVGSYSGVLIVVFGWFVGLFSTYVHERDVNRHTQQVRARIAWHVGNFRRGLVLYFPLVIFAYVVCPVRDFKFFVAKVWG